MNTWRSVALLLVLVTVPPTAHAALTLADLIVPGAKFTAGPLVFSDFATDFIRTNQNVSPVSLTDISVVPLDVGGFTLGSTWEAIGRGASASMALMTFTTQTTGSAPIGDVILSVDQVVVAGNIGAAVFATAFMYPSGPNTSFVGSGAPHRPVCGQPTGGDRIALESRPD